MTDVPAKSPMTSRTAAVDLIRAVALFGICVVNLPFLGLPVDAVFSKPDGGIDLWADVAVQALFAGKFFLLFSFLFGWGFGVQMHAADSVGQGFARRYVRRLVGLALLGVLHAVFVFTGDILLLYALLGLILWPFRQVAPRRLWRLTLWMIPLSMLGLLVLGLMMAAGLPKPGAHVLDGSFADATLARLADWPSTFAFLLVFQGPLAFGAFLIGLAAARTGFFQPGSIGRTRLARAFPWLIGIGLALNLAIAVAPIDESLLALAALLAIAPAAPMLSAAWLHLMLVLGDRMQLPVVLAMAGRNSLTAYILQGILAGLVFGGYGLGFYADLGKAALLALSLLIALAAMLLTAALAQRTGRGPFEGLLRFLTYGPRGPTNPGH